MSGAEQTTIKPVTDTLFGALKQAEAGPLNVGYAEAGPAGGVAVILLHGWPYDIHSFAEVTPVLAAAGYRVIVPFARGYGTTRFLSGGTPRNGQQAALAGDVIALMDALGIWRPGWPAPRPSPTPAAPDQSTPHPQPGGPRAADHTDV